MKPQAGLLYLGLLLLTTGLSGCGMIGPLVGAAMPFAGVKLAFSCIPERTLVDTPSGPKPIEKLEAGDAVVGFSGKPVLILQKHSYLENPETVFLQVTFVGGNAVDLCGMHRLAGIRARDIRVGQTVAGRKVTGVESRRGETHSYDLLTEDAGYRIQGVPVNSMIEEMNAAATSGRAMRRGNQDSDRWRTSSRRPVNRRCGCPRARAELQPETQAERSDNADGRTRTATAIQGPWPLVQVPLPEVAASTPVSTNP